MWLRPVPAQLQSAHPSWIDRIPWPSARAYLIDHPDIDYDRFAGVYSCSFDISWNDVDSSVLVSGSVINEDRVIAGDQSLGLVFEQHLTKLRHWTVDEKFRRCFPGLFEVIEMDRMNELWS